MVTGLETFRNYFEEDTDKYVLIGGTACDIVFSSNDASFRATRDLDIVLIVEALTPEFGRKLWGFIRDGGYKNKARSSGKPQFFRFTEPESSEYPVMIELFARTDFEPEEPDVLTPVHIDDDVSSLSGILLNDNYYRILLEGRVVIDNLSVLRPEYLVLFKAKAYLDLIKKKEEGQEVHSSEYKKHKKDILRIMSELVVQRTGNLPAEVQNDMQTFIESLDENPFDATSLMNYGVTTEDVVARLRDVYL